MARKPGRPEKLKVKDILQVIPGSGGVVAVIARRLGVTWHTAKNYIDKYKTIAEAVDDEDQTVSDIAKGNLVDAIQQGDLPTSKWWLVRKRPDEFGDRLDIEGIPDETKVVVEYIELDKPSD